MTKATCIMRQSAAAAKDPAMDVKGATASGHTFSQGGVSELQRWKALCMIRQIVAAAAAKDLVNILLSLMK